MKDGVMGLTWKIASDWLANPTGIEQSYDRVRAG